MRIVPNTIHPKIHGQQHSCSPRKGLGFRLNPYLNGSTPVSGLKHGPHPDFSWGGSEGEGGSFSQLQTRGDSCGLKKAGLHNCRSCNDMPIINDATIIRCGGREHSWAVVPRDGFPPGTHLRGCPLTPPWCRSSHRTGCGAFLKKNGLGGP